MHKFKAICEINYLLFNFNSLCQIIQPEMDVAQDKSIILIDCFKILWLVLVGGTFAEVQIVGKTVLINHKNLNTYCTKL